MSFSIIHLDVRNMGFNILEKVREEHSPDWLFALGCLNPNRVERLNQLNVWADYKGWIFKYQKRNQSLNSCLDEFIKSYCFSSDDFADIKAISTLRKNISQRNNLMVKQKNISQKLHQGKKEVRARLKNTFDCLSSGEFVSKASFAKIINRGFFSNKEEQIIIEAFKELQQE